MTTMGRPMSNFAAHSARPTSRASNGLARRLGFDAGADGVGGDDEDQDDAGDEPAQKEPLGGDAGDRAVEDHRQ